MFYFKPKGAVAEEVISSIRTVFAYNGSQKEHKRLLFLELESIFYDS